METSKIPLLGMHLDELREVARSLGMPAFAGGQMAKWLYQRRVQSIDEMTNLSKAHRERLGQDYCIGAMPHAACQESADGTKKYLFPVRCTGRAGGIDDGKPGGRYVETVYIPDGDRATLCVSSQVGCKMNCLFCQTGRQGFEGNLSAADILNQIYSLPECEKLTNVVFMGQGEPMDNLEEVMRATQILTSKDGFAWSPRRITVSTVGLKDKLKRFLDESECHVAVSLHSPFHEERMRLMPVEKAMPVADVVEMLRQYDFSHQRRLSFEYTVFDGVNDSEAHARVTVRLLKGLDCRVNLIRFHQIPDVSLHGASEQKMLYLRDYLTHHGLFATIRASRGEDIYAACGLLTTAGRQGRVPIRNTPNK